MIRGQRQRTLDLTQRILEEYWAGKKHLLYQYMDPDIVWIGSMDREYIQGRQYAGTSGSATKEDRWYVWTRKNFR